MGAALKLDQIYKEKAKFNGFVTNLASQAELEATAKELGRARKKGKQEEMDSNVRYEALKTWELGKSLGLCANGSEKGMVSQLEKLINEGESMVKRVEGNQENRRRRAVWGEGNFSWAFREADGRSGGLLSVWNSDKFAIVSNWHMLGAVIVAPSCICLAGDFNSIKRVSERAGRMAESCKRDIEAFDGFIRDSGLLDLPLHGRSFMWYRPDDSCKSHLDRILVNNTWMLQWPNSMQK
ncbi:hypothetical protein ACS0TY_014915 [Phlomoides rotata]